MTIINSKHKRLQRDTPPAWAIVATLAVVFGICYYQAVQDHYDDEASTFKGQRIVSGAEYRTTHPEPRSDYMKAVDKQLADYEAERRGKKKMTQEEQRQALNELFNN